MHPLPRSITPLLILLLLGLIALILQQEISTATTVTGDSIRLSVPASSAADSTLPTKHLRPPELPEQMSPKKLRALYEASLQADALQNPRIARYLQLQKLHEARLANAENEFRQATDWANEPTVSDTIRTRRIQLFLRVLDAVDATAHGRLWLDPELTDMPLTHQDKERKSLAQAYLRNGFLPQEFMLHPDLPVDPDALRSAETKLQSSFAADLQELDPALSHTLFDDARYQRMIERSYTGYLRQLAQDEASDHTRELYQIWQKKMQ